MKSKIQTVEQAFAYTDRDIALLELFKQLPEKDSAYMGASYEQMVIIEALNKEANNGKDWKPDWEDGTLKYSNWVWLKRNPAGVGFVVGGTAYGRTYAHSDCGSRLCLKKPELVGYLNSQFPGIIQIVMAE